MSEASESPRPTRRRTLSLRLPLGAWIVLVALVGVGISLSYRRSPITIQNAATLRAVSSLVLDHIWEIVWSPERERMAVLGWEQPVEIYDTISLRHLETIGQGKKIIHFAFHPRKPEIVALGYNNSTAMILDRSTGKSITLDTENQQPKPVFSPDGSILATGGYCAVQLWRVSDGSLVRALDCGPYEGGLTTTFSADGRYLAVGNRNSTTRLFDASSAEQLAELPRRSSHQLEFHPRGDMLAVAYVDGTIALWSVPEGRLLAERPSGAEELYAVDWSPDGKLLATSGLKGKITIWDATDLSILREYDAPEWVIQVRFSPDGLGLTYGGGPAVKTGKPDYRVETLGVEGALYSLLNRPRP
jgi:WD40 repeat protein